MTDILLIPAKYNKNIELSQDIIDKLPQKIILFSSVQFLNQLPRIKLLLEEKGKNVLTRKSKNFLYEGLTTEPGQLLGCNMEEFTAKEDFDAFLYIGDGLFHPKALLVNNEKDIYCYDPKTSKLKILEKSLYKEYQKRRKGAALKFLTSKNIGIIITTKIGQGSPKRAHQLKKKIVERWPDKVVYIFYASELNFSELENFNFIDIYVNGACSRIGHDDTVRTEKPIINIADVEKLLK
jgi:2-(3-amino-3-carboxypropyl)histidine synthase